MTDANKELIVYVNESGKPTGETAPKLTAHNAETRLHLAFSCYIFDEMGRILVTRRALSKKVWPGVWTNSFCGHPAPGEEMIDAINRRGMFELGLKVKDVVVALPNYRYTTPPFNGIVENEFCPVHLARIDGELTPNPEEVDSFKWLSWQEFVEQLAADQNDTWSFWCKDQVSQFDAELVKNYLA
jgi:isopentenyl-diphosphate Delta-isomerase